MPAKRTAPPGEQDLLLKLAMRRIFWGMNYATRINLKLALPGRRRSADELTDVDVVGFSTGADFEVRMLIADCKSSSKVSTSGRVFWLAGVRQFFAADRAYVVLQRTVPAGVREAAGRLDIDVLSEDERKILENVHGSHAPAAPFFEVAAMERLNLLATTMDKKLDALVRFREHDFWALTEERRMQKLIVELRKAAPTLNTGQKAHRLLVADLVFLFALALLGACRYVSATALADPREALLTYLVGGPEHARARRAQLSDLAAALEGLGDVVPPGVTSALRLEPSYFNDLAETVTRFLRRPRDAQRVLRFLEWWAQAQVGLGAAPATSLGFGYADYTRKLASDLARTCLSAAGLGADWIAWSEKSIDGREDSAVAPEAPLPPAAANGSDTAAGKGSAETGPQLLLP